MSKFVESYAVLKLPSVNFMLLILSDKTNAIKDHFPWIHK